MILGQSTADKREPSELDSLYRSIGEALGQWSQIEVLVSLLFANIMKVGAPSAECILTSVHSIDVRITILDRIGRLHWSRLSSDVQEIWEVLIERLISANRQRNELAHFSVVSSNGGKPKLMPYYYLTNQKPRELALHDVEFRRDYFKDLAHALIYMSNRLGNPPMPQLDASIVPRMLTELRGIAAQRKTKSEKSPK